MYHLLNIEGRAGLPQYLVQHQLVNVGVEIGTHLADYAEYILTHWPGHLICVDPYEHAEGYDDQAVHLWHSDPARIKDRERAAERLAKFGIRHQLWVKNSASAASIVQDGTLDFVYIDGNHTYPYVLQDLTLWWSKVKSGGVVAGHDIICPGEANGGWGRFIQAALQAFSQQIGQELDIYILPEPDNLPASFLIHKP